MPASIPEGFDNTNKILSFLVRRGCLDIRAAVAMAQAPEVTDEEAAAAKMKAAKADLEDVIAELKRAFTRGLYLFVFGLILVYRDVSVVRLLAMAFAE